jgi:hypothetical protein
LLTKKLTKKLGGRSPSEYAFCRMRLRRTFAKTILLAISATRAVVENVDTDLMDLADDAF